jgi:hypothetical protein
MLWPAGLPWWCFFAYVAQEYLEFGQWDVGICAIGVRVDVMVQGLGVFLDRRVLYSTW